MSEIKACFTSRFDGGVLLEADFSQLEVVGLAALSGDERLIEDLLLGMDMHRIRAAELFSVAPEDVTDSQRFLAKRLVFALQYGSGAGGLAKKNGISKETAQQFIDIYYERYQGVKAWQDEVMASVTASRRPTGRNTALGYPRGIGFWPSPSGRTYGFLEQDAPGWARSKDPSFSPTQMKNYGIQGFATGDIMAVYRARVYRWWLGSNMRHAVLPVNTVHDSVMFDCNSQESSVELKNALTTIAKTLQQEMWNLWAIDCPVPFKIECKSGPTWATMEKMK